MILGADLLALDQYGEFLVNTASPMLEDEM